MKPIDYFLLILVVIFVVMVFLGSCGEVLAEEVNWDRLVTAIIQVESGGNPNAVSKAGAIGLMQITPIVLKEWNEKNSFKGNFFKEKDLFSTGFNITIGKWYLHRLKDHYLKNVKVTDHPFRFTIIIVEAGNVAFWYGHTKYIKCAEDYRLALILAAYNGGITRLRRNDYDISKMPKETRNYVKKVLRIYNK